MKVSIPVFPPQTRTSKHSTRVTVFLAQYKCRRDNEHPSLADPGKPLLFNCIAEAYRYPWRAPRSGVYQQLLAFDTAVSHLVETYSSNSLEELEDHEI